LDQIASAARLLNGGGATTAPLPPSAPAGASAGSAAPGPVQPAPRIHNVVEGDTLTRISVRYFGTSARWQEIYDANREVLKGENALRPGQRLRIP
jgi:nucleoid-associated protein YgaU